MRLTDEEVAARIAAVPEHDVCVLRIEDGDFGCEEHREPAPLWLLCQTADGQKFSLDIPETRVVAKCFKENQASYKMLSSCMRKTGEDETFFYFETLV